MNQQSDAVALPLSLAPKLAELLDWYSNLTLGSVDLATRFYSTDVRFKDPFNDVQGLSAVQSIFKHMFAVTNSPRFVIASSLIQHNEAFVTWTFMFELKGRSYSIQGGSHLHFNALGLVTLHRDYWDAAEELFQHLPVIGGVIRLLRKQFKVPI